MKTFSAKLFKEPATDDQIKIIIDLNAKYRFSGVRYPESHFFSEGDAIIIINSLMYLKDAAPKRDYEFDFYYRLYDRFDARYPDNHMTVPVRNYRTPGEDIPDEYENPTQPTWADKQAAVRQSIFLNSLYNSFIQVN